MHPSRAMDMLRVQPASRLAAVGLATGLLLAGCGFVAEHHGNDHITSNATEQAGMLSVLPEFDRGGEQKLLTGTWGYMIGAQQSAEGLSLHHSGEAILTNPDEETPTYIPNPPVNSYGTRIALGSGSDVGLSAHLTDIKGSATMSFMSKPPIRFDERLENQPGIVVTVVGSRATVAVTTEFGASPQLHTLQLDGAASTANIVVAQEGSNTIVNVNGKQLSLPTKSFTDEVWFGMDTAQTFKVNGFSAYPIHGTKVSMVDMSHYYDNVKPVADGLSSLAGTNGHGDKLIGTAADMNNLMANPNETTAILQNVNSIETEMLAKPQAIEPLEGQFEWGELDAQVDFDYKHGIETIGHTLMFGEAYPQWFRDKLANATPDQARALMQNLITTVMTRYDGKHGHGLIRYWDVVNEPLDPDDRTQINKNNLWYKADPDYIYDALRFAHEANPDALIGINEYALESDDDSWNSMAGILQEAKSRGVRVDYVGFQAHFDEETLNDSDAMSELFDGTFQSRTNQLATLGVKFRISEATVAENGDTNMQAKVYAKLLKICLESQNCIGFNMWGLTSNLAYVTTEGNDIGDDAPTTQNGYGVISPRSAWTSLKQTAATK
jgi:endo-1,4-beta-xylanase